MIHRAVHFSLERPASNQACSLNFVGNRDNDNDVQLVMLTAGQSPVVVAILFPSETV